MNIYEIYYQIEWLVPATNAIGGEAFWVIMDDAQQIQAETTAIELYDKAIKTNGKGNVRLIKVQRQVIL